MQELYSIALKALILVERKLNIVVVGANDGKYNDPSYDFNMGRSSSTSVLLIEPNTDLLPYLEENYASHPRHRIANCAIGPEGMLTLYTIKKESWDSYTPDYAKGWPRYRAATGITSASREHIEKNLAAHTDINPNEVIGVLNVPSKALGTLLSELNWPTPIDVLQIDAEGYDDAVIQASSLPVSRPKLIYFETCHIPPSRLKNLVSYLSGLDYKTYTIGENSLAVDSGRNPLCIYLNGVILMAYWMQKLKTILLAR